MPFFLCYCKKGLSVLLSFSCYCLIESFASLINFSDKGTRNVLQIVSLQYSSAIINVSVISCLYGDMILSDNHG